MAHERTETIQLPQDVDSMEARNRINNWLASEVGRKYKVKDRRDDYVFLERRWTPTWQYLLLCIGICPGIICILLSKSWVNIRVTLQIGSAQIHLKSNNRNESENDYHSFMYALGGSSTGGGVDPQPTW